MRRLPLRFLLPALLSPVVAVAAPAFAGVNDLVINEIDADTPGSDTAEFIELYDGGDGNTSLDGLVVVLFNGSDDASYAAFDLDGHSTDANGYFLLGNAGVPGVGLTFENNTLQNGADAVGLFVGDAIDFPVDTPIPLTPPLDALVYDTNDSDDAGLAVLVQAGQPQINEDKNGEKALHSIARIGDGAGGRRMTSAYDAVTPTPGAANPAPSTDVDLELVAVVEPSLVVPGGAITAGVILENKNTAATTATDVVVTIDIGRAALASQMADQGSVNAAGSTVSWAVGTLAPGAAVSLDLVLTAPATGTVSLTAAAATSATDTDSTNDADSGSVTVASAPVCGPASADVLAGGLVSLDVLSGVSDADGDLVPSTLRVVSGPAAGSAVIDAQELDVTAPTSSAADLSVTYAVDDQLGLSCQGTATVRVFPVLTVVGEPQDVVVNAGQTAMLSVTATGEDVGYAWFAGMTGDDSTPVGTAASFTTPAMTSDGHYWVRLTERGGPGTGATVNSRTALVSVNDAPAIAAIDNVRTALGDALMPIAVTVSDPDHAAGALTVSAASNNPLFLPQSALTLTGTGANRQLTLSPQSGMGSAQVTVTVQDPGGLSASTSFNVLVTSAALRSLSADQTTLDVQVGQTADLTLTGGYSDGSSQTVTGAAIWTSEDTGVASVNAQGRVFGESRGQTRVRAELDGQSVHVDVTVVGACGDGTTDSGQGETCDDGNREDGDGCDADCHIESDSDNDAVPNTLDNCPFVHNPGQEDTRGTDAGDACEDTDNDTVVDADDNCPDEANTDQFDRDADMVGDVCDACPDEAAGSTAADCPVPDAGMPDAGEMDAGTTPDAGEMDAGTTPDAGTPDAGSMMDMDAGHIDLRPVDAGAAPLPPVSSGGCAQSSGASVAGLLALLALLGWRRRG